VGYEEGGQLTESITKSPYSVLLLDEIEKAHNDIYNILLQVMDAGRLTDANGRTADFRNVILVLTSNAGAADLAKGHIGFVQTDKNIDSMEAIKKIFSPEFINRLDSIVNFKHLDPSILLDIAKKLVNELQMQLQKQKVNLQVDEEALKWLAQKGYDKVYGARPMARTVEEYIKKTLVDELLFGKLIHGGHVNIYLNASQTGLRMEIEELEPVHST
jgi:ATP-dependent Clp protease ATP-binding subunit ClpA